MTVLESERHAIVLIDPDRKPPTLERMEPHPRHVHLSRMRRSTERGKDQLQALRMLRLYLASVPCLEQCRKCLVPKAFYHRKERNPAGYVMQPIWLRAADEAQGASRITPAAPWEARRLEPVSAT